ncbi:MAG: HAD-IIA family hydrolase [Actinomycetes bacterium]
MTAPVAALIDGYDAALFDLDGVVYLGPAPVEGAAEGIAALRRRQAKLGFVTNNAARTPAAVAAHLRDLSVPCDDDDVVTSAQAAAHLLAERFGAGARVLVVGGEGVLAALAERELVPVHSADDDPVAVIQGYSFDLTWAMLNEAAIAIQRGAHWVATNTDSTRPTDRGIVPGNGAAVAAVATAVTAVPEVAGKPFRPLIDETVLRLRAQHPVFVGDRIDTDIAGAGVVGMDSLFVLTGAHGPAELLAAPPGARPTHLGRDLRALLQPPRSVVAEDGRFFCGAATATADDGALRLEVAAASGPRSASDDGRDHDDQVDALWAAAHLAWRSADESRPLDLAPTLAALAELA